MHSQTFHPIQLPWPLKQEQQQKWGGGIWHTTNHLEGKGGGRGGWALNQSLKIDQPINLNFKLSKSTTRGKGGTHKQPLKVIWPANFKLSHCTSQFIHSDKRNLIHTTALLIPICMVVFMFYSSQASANHKAEHQNLRTCNPSLRSFQGLRQIAENCCDGPVIRER